MRVPNLFLRGDAADGIADGGKSELRGVELRNGNPLQRGDVVVWRENCVLRQMTPIEEVERVDVKSTVVVDVGKGERIVAHEHIGAEFFEKFAMKRLFAGFAKFKKPARKVECAFGGVVGAD